jgi:hypothetical protein
MIVVIGLCSDTAITQHEKRFAFAKAPDLAQNLRNVHRAVKGTKVGFRGGILTKIHYSHLGASFALVSVPVARVGGTTISRTVKIDQR